MIGYITTEYPAISHTFIEREVEALRRRGRGIDTTSIRRASDEAMLSADHRRAFQSTYTLLPPRWGEVLMAHARVLIRHPKSLLSIVRLSLGMSRPGTRGHLRQIIYTAEAITAWNHWRKCGVRHIHAHFVAVPADVAMLAAQLGRSCGAGPQSFSFTVHGLIELWEVHAFRVAEKIRHADAVVCVSDFTRSQVMAMVEEEHWSKLAVVRCGIQPSRYETIADPPPGRPRVLCVGRLASEKGQSLLVRAVGLLRDQGLDVELELVGDGPARAELERLTEELHLRDRVQLSGTIGQDQINAHFGAATIYCLPSLWEGIPVVLMEAMACRRPVVATAIAGIRELVRDGETGLLVSAGRVDELAAALRRLLEDPDLRLRLGDAGQQLVGRLHDVDACAGDLAELFDRVARSESLPDYDSWRPKSGRAPALGLPIAPDD